MVADFKLRDGVLIPQRGYELNADVVVVGSGPGGAPLAKSLAQSGVNVIIIEEGDYVKAEDLPYDINERPLRAFQKVYRNSGFTVAYNTIPGRPPIPIPIGVGLGGSSLINSGTCLRASPDTFSHFEDFGVKIKYEDIEPFYEEVERSLSVSEAPYELLGNHGRIFLEGAKKLGWSASPLKRNAKDCKGCGQCQYICPENAKLSMAVSYIPQAIKNGAKFIVNSRVEKLILHNNKIVGVEGRVVKTPLDEHTDSSRKKMKFRVFGKVVVLSAGSIYTPHILKKSGIALNSVGKYLTIHPGIRISAEFDFEINQWEGIPQGYLVDEFKKYGIMIEGIATPPIIGAMTLPFIGEKFKALLKRYNNIMSTGVMVSDSGYGRILSLPFLKDPIMIYNLTKSDADRFKIAIYNASKIFAESGARRIFPHIWGIDELKPDEIKKILDWKIKPSHLEPVAFHPLGTCRMGNSPHFSAVDENGKYHIVENLYISDGSIFPFPLSVNPQLTIMAFSLKIAKFILENIL